jgi:hypothetical protein
MNTHTSKFDSSTNFIVPISVRNTTATGPLFSSAVSRNCRMQQAGTKSASTTIGKEVNKMKIDLTQREVPSLDEQPGVFADVVKFVKTDKRGKSFEMLVLVGQLAATKSNGKRFTANASFNLDDTRGVNRLKETLKVWRGSDALPDLGDFDPETEFLGKGFLTQPAVEDKGGKKEIRLARIKRSADQQLAVSPDFVRAGSVSQP